MRRSVAFTALMFMAPFAACQAPAPEAGPLSEEDVAAIAALMEQHVELVTAADVDAIAAMYTEDAAQMPPNAPLVQGRAAIRDWFAGFPSVTDYTVTRNEINGRDGLAYYRGSYSISMQIEGMAEPITDTGKNLVIYKKQPDGSWLVAAGIWNSDLPLTQPESTPEEPQVE